MTAPTPLHQAAAALGHSAGIRTRLQAGIGTGFFFEILPGIIAYCSFSNFLDSPRNPLLDIGAHQVWYREWLAECVDAIPVDRYHACDDDTDVSDYDE
jgi:hypothetical protein